MLFGILNRMIFWELLRVFLLALAALTGLFLIGGIIQQATQFGVSAPRLLRHHSAARPEQPPVHDPRDRALRHLRRLRPAGARQRSGGAQGRRGRSAHDAPARVPPRRPRRVRHRRARVRRHPADATRSWHKEATRDPEEALYSLLKRERSFRDSNKNPSTRTTTLYVLYVRDVQDRRLIDVVVKRKTAPKDERAGRSGFRLRRPDARSEARRSIRTRTRSRSIRTSGSSPGRRRISSPRTTSPSRSRCPTTSAPTASADRPQGPLADHRLGRTPRAGRRTSATNRTRPLRTRQVMLEDEAGGAAHGSSSEKAFAEAQRTGADADPASIPEERARQGRALLATCRSSSCARV